MDLQFIPGEKVTLRTGGPEMTVRGEHYDVVHEKYNEDIFDCIWFEKDRSGKREVMFKPYHQSELIPLNRSTFTQL